MQTHCEWEKRNQALDKLKKSRADVIEKKRETALKKLENTKQKLRSKANRQLALEKLDDKSFLRAVQILETDAALQIEPAGLGEGAALDAGVLEYPVAPPIVVQNAVRRSNRVRRPKQF